VATRETTKPIWQEERLRYEVLRFIYEHAGASCQHEVTGTQIGAALQLTYEDLYRIVHFLDSRGYLHYMGAGPRVCLSEEGRRYLEELARQRRSIRG
jgi:DNA-binding MarR family transcriptional regulator